MRLYTRFYTLSTPKIRFAALDEPLAEYFADKLHTLSYLLDFGVLIMKRTIPYWQIGGFIFTAIAGTLLHFLFDWTGGNMAAALFSAVNESIWEHLKLLFYPMLTVALLEYFIWGKTVSAFWCIKLIGILTGLAVIPVVYYTYTGILGVNADWFNITLFFLTAGFVLWLETKLFLRDFSCKMGTKWAVFIIILIAVTFTLFTFLPPRIALFRDPVTGTYGYFAQRVKGAG